MSLRNSAVAAVAAAVTVLPATANAQIPSPVRISVAGGALGASPGSFGHGAANGMVTVGAPIVRVGGGVPQVTYAHAFDGSGRYQLTGESVHHLGLNGTYFGAGAGVGRLTQAGATGAIYDAVAGTRVAPNTALEARYYGGLRRGVGSGFGIGLRVGVL